MKYLLSVLTLSFVVFSSRAGDEEAKLALALGGFINNECKSCGTKNCDCGCNGDARECVCSKKDSYCIAYNQAVKYKDPLVVFVHQPDSLTYTNTRHCRWDNYPGAPLGPCVVVGLPNDNGGMDQSGIWEGVYNADQVSELVDHVLSNKNKAETEITSYNLGTTYQIPYFSRPFLAPVRSGGC